MHLLLCIFIFDFKFNSNPRLVPSSLADFEEHFTYFCFNIFSDIHSSFFLFPPCVAQPAEQGQPFTPWEPSSFIWLLNPSFFHLLFSYFFYLIFFLCSIIFFHFLTYIVYFFLHSFILPFIILPTLLLLLSLLYCLSLSIYLSLPFFSPLHPFPLFRNHPLSPLFTFRLITLYVLHIFLHLSYFIYIVSFL